MEIVSSPYKLPEGFNHYLFVVTTGDWFLNLLNPLGSAYKQLLLMFEDVTQFYNTY